jgi:cytochrome oxidase Cu insertion factor (SCO1/SenC/PrrC family)
MRTLLCRVLPVLILGLPLASCSQSGPTVGTRVAIGALAPEIQGTDADGKSFKLSDYRGKVVMLDFWGNW